MAWPPWLDALAFERTLTSDDLLAYLRERMPVAELPRVVVLDNGSIHVSKDEQAQDAVAGAVNAPTEGFTGTDDASVTYTLALANDLAALSKDMHRAGRLLKTGQDRVGPCLPLAPGRNLNKRAGLRNNP